MIYVKKITASLAWLRRLDAKDPETGAVIACDPQPLMRIRARLVEGWQEFSDKGEYVRWIGKIGAEAVQRGGNEVTTYVSRNMILPQVAEDFILQQFTQEQKETNVKGRTGTHYVLQDDFGECSFVIDLYLKQPSNAGRPSATGYEFEMRVVEAERMENPVASLGVDLPALVGVQAQAALPFEAVEPAHGQVSAEPARDPVPSDPHHEAKGKHKNK